jgi:hypothetical protein
MMELIIEAEGVKRLLYGPFNLCASRADLASLRDQLDYVLREADGDQRFNYGWITIHPQPIKAPAGTVPRPWKE